MSNVLCFRSKSLIKGQFMLDKILKYNSKVGNVKGQAKCKTLKKNSHSFVPE